MAAITPASNRRLKERLERDVEGEVLFDRFSRGRYATDASVYQMMPHAVVIPRTFADVEAVLGIAREEGVPVLARGGGTSQCGQTVNEAIVIDFSRHLNKVVEFDEEAQTAVVEPGLVLDHLNDQLKSHELLVSRRCVDRLTGDDRGHDGQQLMRVEVDPLWHVAGQCAGD